MLPQFFARRYLFSPKSRSVVNLISGLSVVAVAMPVAAMIVLLSVFNGFESLVKSMCSAFDADLTVSARQGQTFAADAVDTAALGRISGVEAMSFVLEESALLEHGDRQATATVRGVDDAYEAVFPLSDAVAAGEYRVRVGDLERLVIGQSMAYMLGVRTLADADVGVYAVRRGSFSSLLPFDNYTRRTIPLGGVYTLDLETERTYVLASLRMAQELFSRPGRVSGLVVRLRDGADAVQVRDAVAQQLGGDYRVRTRYELRASFYRIMTYEKWGIFFISLLVLVVASFSVAGDADRREAARHRDAARAGRRYDARAVDIPQRRAAYLRSRRGAGRGAGRRCDAFAAALRADRDSGRNVPHEELSCRIPSGRPRGGACRFRRGGLCHFEYYRVQHDKNQR